MPKPTMRRTLVALAAAAVAAGTAAAPAAAAPKDAFDVLVFSKTAGWRHDSIPAGQAAIRALGARHGFRVRVTEDASVFTPRTLRGIEVVVFLNTTGTILDAGQRRAIERYVTAGGGFAGVHSAADTEYDWPFYGRLVGARFHVHPPQQTAMFHTEDRDTPATRHLAPTFRVYDEFYSFQENPRPDVHVLLSIDEATYEQDPNTSYLPGDDVETTTGVMGDHPMSWCHDLPGRKGEPGGRSFYTALGHEAALYEQRWYRRHLLGGIRMAAGVAAADCSRPRG